MIHSNGMVTQGFVPKPLLSLTMLDFERPTVHEALGKWYNYFKTCNANKDVLFTELPKQEVEATFKTDMELVPSVLMEELIADNFHYDRCQYVQLIQALLINISNVLFEKSEGEAELCLLIENNLQFLQDFYAHYFDSDSRLSKYCNSRFIECYKLKLDYWEMKLQDSSLLTAFKECFVEKVTAPDNGLTYKKLGYLKGLLQQIESATTVLSENYIRELLTYHNFNSVCFVEYETGQLKEKIKESSTTTDAIAILQNELFRIETLKLKSSSCFDTSQPSVKKQLHDWVTAEIKQLELQDRKAADKDLLIDTESKIQTSLSVAKLAVLIRLMVVDKIIINKSVAPMLRTVTRLFTTLQKDEISFGSLETKYHAPDKTTLTTMKEMLEKWSGLVGRL